MVVERGVSFDFEDKECNGMIKDSCAVYKYKCRHCGRVFKSNTESGGHDEIVNTVLTNSIYKVDGIGSVSMMAVHKCSKCRYGIADLVGCDIVEQDIDVPY